MEKQKPTLKELLSAMVFIGVISVLFILNILVPSPEILVSERRVPVRLPAMNVSSVMSGAFMKQFETYAADHFVFRDAFRGINTVLIFDIYRQNDKSGLYRSSEVGLGQFYHIDEVAFNETSMRIKGVAESFDEHDMNIYYSIIPDKSVFAERYFPGFNLEAAEGIIHDVLGGYEYIRLIDDLNAECYYRTDLHWDQTKITGIASTLLSGMGVEYKQTGHQVVTVGEFHGVYAGQYVLPYPQDIMTYFDITGIEVSYLNERTLEFESGYAHEPSRISGVDPYDIFLRGPQPLVVIENKNAPTTRELYVFRDSYGSSLTPLFSDAYSRVIIIDLRYIHQSILEQFIDFVPGSDILFIFGAQIFNSPDVFRTQ